MSFTGRNAEALEAWWEWKSTCSRCKKKLKTIRIVDVIGGKLCDTCKARVKQEGLDEFNARIEEQILAVK